MWLEMIVEPFGFLEVLTNKQINFRTNFMIKPIKPIDETQRLQALYSLNILDTPRDERFDRLTRMAKRIFDVPVALVTLLDSERQWVKSCAGIMMGNLPRDMSFCGHAILGDDVFVIPDMLKDKRFINNPMVIDPRTKVRFYAGCPIKSLGGSKLGTLCILDQKPREFSKEDHENLEDLAAMVERELSALELATFDELTGLLNRRGFMLLAENNLKLAIRQNVKASLFYFDLNGFKNVNDSFGHAKGDEVLVTVANLLKKHLRESDPYGRLGGDEFVGLLMGSDYQETEEIINRIKECLISYNESTNNELNVGFSYGIIEYNREKHSSLKDLIDDGDQLMYEMKNDLNI